MGSQNDMRSRKTFEEIIARYFPNLCENYKPRDPRTSMNLTGHTQRKPQKDTQ